jgi:DNA-binding CsgD family transcriptional regulator/uncharacterized glyoxalase superfamily protein PhnB
MENGPYRRIGRPHHNDILTPAEWEVLAGVREGKSNQEIAEDRSCHVETIRFHLKNLRGKLAVHTRQELRAFPGRPAHQIEAARRDAARFAIREQIPLVHVQDMESSLLFYSDTLGFEIVGRWPDTHETPGWVALGAGGARVMLRVGHPRRQVRASGRPGLVCMNFYVAGLDEVRDRLIEAGYPCSEPETLFYGAREFDVLDPDANELAIVEFAASDPVYLPSAGGSPRGKKRRTKR